MGSSSSRPSTAYPFPMPGSDPVLPSKSRMWSFSTKKKNKKTRDSEKLDDFIVAKYTAPTPAPAPAPTYPFPYYPQMQSAFPTYYAPVQMAFVQPFAVQQPVLAMPVPMVTAAPVQPAVAPAPAIQSAPAMQMPVPAPAPPSALAPAIQSAAAMQMPVPALAPQSAPAPVIPLAPIPPPSSARAPTAPRQMPQPHPPPPPTQFPTLPPSPIPTQPVIPPPPIVTFEPPRTGPDSTRIRFTDFYRPPDLPPHRRPSVDEPMHPPTAGQPGRTPYSASMPMPAPSSTPAPMPMPMPTPGPSAPGPTPATIPVSNNPLPPPPVDIWDTSPYRHVLANLPTELPDLLDLHRADILVGDSEPVPRPSSRLGTLFGSKDKGKKPLRGLFRSRSNAGQGDLGMGPSSGSRHGHGRSQTMTSFVIQPQATGASMPSAGGSSMDMPVPAVGQPIKFDHTGDYAGFVNHSAHRVMYKNKMYPTALHLLEALKFTHQPALQERIRTCRDVTDMYPLSASFQEHVRADWGQVFLRVMEDVLYLKFKQHPTLRALLLRTGLADIIYSDENAYWGDGPLGNGANELGRALVRLRERLRHEGEN